MSQKQAPKPASKTAKDFNEKAKTYLYSVSVRPKYSRRDDFSAEIKQATADIRQLARDEGYSPGVRIRSDDGALAKLGIFFMNAPEKFAALVRKLESVQSVEKPAEKTATRKTRAAKSPARKK